jgi:hypothetical protein
MFYTSTNENGQWNEPKEIEIGMNAGKLFQTSDGQYLFFTDVG